MAGSSITGAVAAAPSNPSSDADSPRASQALGLDAAPWKMAGKSAPKMKVVMRVKIINQGGSKEGYFFFPRQVLDFLGSWFYAFLLLCFSAVLPFCFSASLLLCVSACPPFAFAASLLVYLSAFLLFALPAFCFSCFSVFHAYLLYLLLFFSASLLLCFYAFLLLLLLFYFFLSSVMRFCRSTSCSSAPLLLCFLSLLPICFLSFILLYSVLFVSYIKP
jgi:hypothetical protein